MESLRMSEVKSMHEIMKADQEKALLIQDIYLRLDNMEVVLQVMSAVGKTILERMRMQLGDNSAIKAYDELLLEISKGLHKTQK
jgi:hypothetical protein